MRPSIIHYVGLFLRRNPAPRNIPVINAERGREIRSARMGEQGISRGTQEEREIILGIRRDHVSGVGPWKNQGSG